MASCKLRRVAEERKSDIYHAPASGSGYRRVSRRKRRLTTRSQYPVPHRGERRLSPREIHRRILFWSLLLAFVAVGGYALYRSRNFKSDAAPRTNLIETKDPVRR